MKWGENAREQRSGLHVSRSDREGGITRSFSSSCSHPPTVANAAAQWIISAFQRNLDRTPPRRSLTKANDSEDDRRRDRMRGEALTWRTARRSHAHSFCGLFVREQKSNSLFSSWRRGAGNLAPRSIEKSRFHVTNPWPQMTNKSGICRHKGRSLHGGAHSQTGNARIFVSLLVTHDSNQGRPAHHRSVFVFPLKRVWKHSEWNNSHTPTTAPVKTLTPHCFRSALSFPHSTGV